MLWQTTRFRLDLTKPLVMGIVNVTPDSFAGSGERVTTASALHQCEQLLHDGANLLDVGGQSTRPGSSPVTLEEELARVVPVLQGALALGCPVSIDTNKAEVMEVALALGVDIVNDIDALQSARALDVVAANDRCGVCLMHKRGMPLDMQRLPEYQDVVVEVACFLAARLAALDVRGIAPNRVVLDPGIGFGKTVEHNLDLLRRQQELMLLGRPLMIGWSRKSTLGAITGRPVDQRQSASVAAALLAVQAGARIVRVHDVAATVDALKVWQVVNS